MPNKSNFTQQQKDHVSKMEKIVGSGAANKLGTYQESTGGGTPIPKGEKLKDHPEAKRVSQPRDEDGKFTYNAVNLKGLKYGPSRGTTVPPFMRGVEMTFATKKGGNSTVSNGKVFKTEVSMSADEFMDSMQEYLETEGGFKAILDAKVSGKKGRRSSAEKEMLQSGKEGFVDTPKDGSTTNLSKYGTIDQFKEDMNTYLAKVKGRKTNFTEPKKDDDDDKNTDGPNDDNPDNPSGGAGGTGDGPDEPNSGGSMSGTIDEKDVDLAKNNPKEFMTKYQKQIDEVTDLAKQKGKGGISVKALVALVAEGKTDVFERIKDSLK